MALKFMMLRKNNSAKIITLLFTFILTLATVVASDKVSGTIKLNSGRFINVVIKIPKQLLSKYPDYIRMQGHVTYFNDNGEKVKVHPDQAQEVRFKYNKKEVVLRSVYFKRNYFTSGSNYFCLLEQDGYLKVFSYYFYRHNKNGSILDHIYILQKPEQKAFYPRRMRFRKDMAKYFDDCYALVEQIVFKRFKRDDIFKIALFYNAICK